MWNNLSQYLINADSIGQFKRTIKQVSDLSDSHMAISCKAFFFIFIFFSFTDDFPCLNKVYLLTRAIQKEQGILIKGMMKAMKARNERKL